MKNRFVLLTALLVLMLAALAGCSKSEKKAQLPAKEKGDVSSVAARVYAQMKAEDYATLYQESAPGFKKSGSEAQFVNMMQKLKEKNGALKDAKEVEAKAGAAAADGTKSYQVVYDVEYEKGPQKQALTLVQPKDGKPALTAIDVLSGGN